jgi:hypothetical protein
MSTLLRETQPANNRIAGYLPQHADANGTYVATGENNPMPVQVNFVKGMVPVQFQESLRTQAYINTHTNVIIGADTYNYGNVIDARGYDKIAVNVLMLNGTGMIIKLETSGDGVNYNAQQTLYDGSSAAFVGEVGLPSPYVRLIIKNKDTAAVKTTSANIFLKA